MPGKPLDAKEIELVKKWVVEEVAPSEIAERLGRNKSTITRKIKSRRFAGKKTGRKLLLSEAQVDSLEKRLMSMVKEANGTKEITVQMLQRRSRCKASLNTIRARLHERGIYFYGMRLKPLLTNADIAERYHFGRKYKGKPASWWKKFIHLIIDVKFFPVYLNGKARCHAAQSGCRGAYRRAGEGLSDGYVKPNPKLKYNTGANGVHVLAGVGRGKVLLWEYLGGRWNGDEAARLYEGPMKSALQKAYPGRSRFRVLEDNDPSGFKSRKGIAAKARAGIETFDIPRHSPQLNLCDYWLWRAVNTRMREMEQGWAHARKEGRDAYLRRLKRTAMSLPADEINRSFGSMKRRCQDLCSAKGGQIEG